MPLLHLRQRTPTEGDTVLGQGTTFGKGQAMTLKNTAGRPAETPQFHCTIAAQPVVAQMARHLVRDCFAGQLNADVVADVGLVVTELVANAVTAIGDSGSVEFAAWMAGGDVVVLVIDQADGEPAARDEDASAETGRGLFLVEELTRDWGWAMGPVPRRKGRLGIHQQRR